MLAFVASAKRLHGGNPGDIGFREPGVRSSKTRKSQEVDLGSVRMLMLRRVPTGKCNHCQGKAERNKT